jgi:hypothetical protein
VDIRPVSIGDSLFGQAGPSLVNQSEVRSSIQLSYGRLEKLPTELCHIEASTGKKINGLKGLKPISAVQCLSQNPEGRAPRVPNIWASQSSAHRDRSACWARFLISERTRLALAAAITKGVTSEIVLRPPGLPSQVPGTIPRIR